MENQNYRPVIIRKSNILLIMKKKTILVILPQSQPIRCKIIDVKKVNIMKVIYNSRDP